MKVVSIYKLQVTMLTLLSVSLPLLFFMFFLFSAYQLRLCRPPPTTPNAEILTASQEFKIGNYVQSLARHEARAS